MKKKITALLLLCALLMTLTGCAPEKKVEETINAIGKVHLGSQEMIEYAESLYFQLDVSKKVKVTNKSTLDRARSEFDRQVALADTAQEAIDAIGKVTLGSGAAVEEAREAYEMAKEYDTIGRLTGAEKTLLAAETKLAQLMEEAAQVLEKAQDLYDKKKYAEAVSLLKADFDVYVEQGMGYDYGTLLVQCLCGQSQLEFNNNHGLKAVQLLMDAANYEDYCDTTAYRSVEKQLSSYANDLNKKTPKNEEVIKRTQGAGANYVKVKAGSYDTVVKLEMIDDPTKYVLAYVKANKEAIIYILNGEYKLKYTCGPIWFGEEDLFGDHATFYETGDILTMAGYTQKVGKGYIQERSAYGGELTEGYGSDFGYQNITPDSF